MKNATVRPKHQQVYDQLVSILTRGSYKAGDRLPSEREFAAELNVNVLTVRRAFRDLIAADFVTKRVGSGTYLNREITRNWNDHAVNLAIDCICNSAVQKLFEQAGKIVAEKNGREYRIVHTSPASARDFVRACLQYRQPTIFCGTLPDYREFREDIASAPELFVSAGALRSGLEIPSVIGSDAVGIDMLMNHLRRLGHRRIVLALGTKELGEPGRSPASILAMQKTAWMTRLGNEYDPELFCPVSMDLFGGDQMAAAYKAMKKILSAADFTAVICATDEIMYGAMAAIRDAGKQIPRDVSVVSIGNTNLSRFANPPVTGVDLNLRGHLDEAFRMLFHNLQEPDRIEMLRVVKPKLIERESTSVCQNNKHSKSGGVIMSVKEAAKSGKRTTLRKTFTLIELLVNGTCF